MKASGAANYLRLVASMAVPLLAGFIGSIFTSKSVATWYSALRKPPITPPGGVFGPVWTALYVTMGIALYLVWRNGFAAPRVKGAVALFAVQLVLNAFWSIAFFGMRSPLLGSVVIAALWVAILLTMIAFYRISRLAGSLLVPYMLWVSFASILNFWIYALNR